jgi:tellurite resistance protein TerC
VLKGSIPSAGSVSTVRERPGPAAPQGAEKPSTVRLDQPEVRLPVPIAQSTADVAAGPLAWVALLAFLAAMVVVDLRLGSARRAMTVRLAGAWSAIWIGLAVAFGAGLWLVDGGAAGEAYFAGYVMERALSLDNVFVFTLIFAALAVPREAQPRLLLGGILVALVLRGVFIVAGAEALERFSWVAWPFAALLAWTGWRILRAGDEHDEGSKIVDRIRARVPGARPAVLALLAVALADILFAVDSVPAVLAITTDTYIVFAANAFALLGLSALFYLVSGLVARFRFLNAGLGVLLVGIAGKLAYGEIAHAEVPTSLTLAFIGGVLAAAIVASVLVERRGEASTRPQEG